MPNLRPHLQQAEGQGEEELLQPGEGGGRRQGEKEKKLHSHPEVVFSLHVASLAILYPKENKPFNIWLTLY